MPARLSVDLPMGASSNKPVFRSGSTFQCHPKLAAALRNLAKVSRISWMSDERRGASGGNREVIFMANSCSILTPASRGSAVSLLL